ncbi:Protein of unknown function (DUF2946) [Pseudoduganella lurida]|uniref:DUF2946 family protein n=1 Tax=Pseudoduganella lurida TaxID=1036180 RepID=A0A562RB27_9BURK|nr:DUF2946 family protein [Pseudoduganella lurida]TWI66123.1 Protein of unknown function (DUF2946) [Pseudoduganella lurida]
MDDIVKQAMAKWPNVPHCYGWLGLDARGHWRMRDERAQHLDLPGDKLAHEALIGFINRNYLHDDEGRWYFQNGPQRVYVNLEATPFIARTDPAHGFVLHTGALLDRINAVAMTEAGELIFQAGDTVAQLDDRDAAQVLALLEKDGRPVPDEALLAWLEGGADDAAPTLPVNGRLLTLARTDRAGLADRFGFQRTPTMVA